MMHSILGILLVGSLHLAAALSPHSLAAHISAVQIVPTIDLVKDVPRKDSDELVAQISSRTSINLRVHGKGDDWMDPKIYSSSLKSVIVSAERSSEGPKICVLMADSRHSLWDDSRQRHALFEEAQSRRYAMWLLPAMVNLAHAVQHGYDFAHIQMPFKHLSRHAAWLKLVAMRLILPRYEYVMYLDSDAFFRQPGIPQVVETMISEGRLGRDKIIAVTKEDLEYPDVANTGIVLLRNNEQTLQMLHDWWYSVVQHLQYMMYKRAWSWEQAAFTWIIYPAYNQSVSLLTLKDWNSPEGKHIRHIWSLFSEDEREQNFMDAALSAVRQLEGSSGRALTDPVEASAQLVGLVDEVLAEKLH